MEQITKEAVFAALSTVEDPEKGKDLVTLGRIRGLWIEGSKVRFQILSEGPASPFDSKLARMKEEARAAVGKIPGVLEVTVETAASAPSAKMPGRDNLIPQVGNVVAVASGKGGVGKTTVAVNLSVALCQAGASVGLLDADITGPNVPMMMGIRHAPSPEEEKIVPAEAHGVKLVSMAFFVKDETPMIWRGPMLHGAIQQFFRDVAWGALDYLIVDLPPGTSDAQLSLAQLVKVAGAVIVTTPQEVALADVRRGVEMFKKVQVPILGVIENMSYFACPHCGKRSEIFAHGGGRAAAEKLGVPFLGEIPIDLAVREGGDTGMPIVAADPASPISESFRQVAKNLVAQIAIANAQAQALKIIQ